MSWSWKSIPLHHKILGALVLGAIFGALFNMSKYELSITTRVGKADTTVQIRNWDRFEFFPGQPFLEVTFGKEDQLKILSYFRKLPLELQIQVPLVVTTPEGQHRFQNIKSIDKVKTWVVQIKPIGQLFIRLLMFIAIPLVLASLLVGAASLGDIRRVGRIGGKTLLWYLITTVVAITIGLTLVNTLKPGIRISADAREKLLVEFQADTPVTATSPDLVDMFVKIVPTNPIAALANAEMLQIIFFALMIGITLTLVPAEKSKPVLDFFDGFSDMMIRMVGLIMNIAPFGVFALIAATVGEFGFDILGTLFWYALTLVVGLTFHNFVVLGTMVRIFTGIPIKKFFFGMRDAMLMAFSTSSSAATLPVNMRCVEENLGVPKKIASFVLPLGATVNMDGTAMYQAVATVFIAQVYGYDLNLAQQLTILLTAVLASIGTAPVPGVGLIMLIIVLQSVNIPEEGIALILGIDRFLDMCRTVPNIVGDAAVSAVIAKSEGVLEKRD